MSTPLVDPVTACSLKLDGEPWGATIPVVVGDTALGVRVDGPATEERVRALLAPWICDGLDVQANYSVRLAAAPSERGPRPLHLLYRSFAPIVRSRHPVDVADALLLHLGDHAERSAHAGSLVVLRGVAVSIDERRAAVVGPELWSGLNEVDRRLRAAGRTPLNRPRVLLDLDGRIVSPDTSLAPPPEGYAAFGGTTWSSPVERRFAVERWVLVDAVGGSRARAVQLAARLVDNPLEVGWQAVLDTLARSIQRAEVGPARGATDLAEALLRA